MFNCEPIGRFRGGVNPEVDSPELRSWLARLPDVPEARSLSAERDNVKRLAPPGDLFSLALKRYPASPAWKTLADERSGRGGAARRAFLHALHLADRGAPTPRPVAWLERRGDSGVEEQYLVTECISDACTFRGALLHHYYEKPLCRDIMRLLEVAATAIRRMHDTGLAHRDLGNRNLLVARDAEGRWDRAWVMGLHRARVHSSLDDRRRGRDNARITLPSDLRRVFLEMQYAPRVPPEEFLEAERRARRARVRHTRFRRLRHPLANPARPPRPYPPEQDIWIWDDRSMQAIPSLRGRDKHKYYRKRDLFPMAADLAVYGPAIRRASRGILSTAWTRPVEMDGRVGLSLNLEPDRFEKERRWLEPLGPLPLLVRLYHHESEARRRYAIDAVRKLKAEGHRVTVALVQDRRAILFPQKWRDFVNQAGGALSGFVEAVEAGHAINRVKWGVWNLKEYAELMRAFDNWSQRFPQIPLMGPAGIDFEYPRVLPLMKRLPPGQRWSAFSHHLYVDRRGAPENAQSGYDTVAKLALARAMARAHPDCDERVVVSEVNWPLKGTGVWSPVGSPYQSPGVRHNDPSVDEDTYADYMRRYLLLSLCSGMADRVYWWNLAAHGFGLIDDRDPGGWRPRPAYHAFKELTGRMRGATYLRRHGDDRHYRLDFQSVDRKPFSLEWDVEENPS